MASVGLSDTVKRMQQALSEKYGIITHDVKSNVSTVPQTRPLSSPLAIVGGRLTQVGTGTIFPPNTFVLNSPSQLGSVPTMPGIQTPTAGPGLLDTLKKGIAEVGPTGLLIGLAVVGVLLLKK